MPRRESPDLSIIADRVQPQTWSLFQSLRSRMRSLKGVTMKILYEKHSREPVPAFYFSGRQLFHLHARGEEISATLHTDNKTRSRILEDLTVDWRLREQVRKRTWAAFTLRSSKDLDPFLELVKAKYQLLGEDLSGRQLQERPIAV